MSQKWDTLVLRSAIEPNLAVLSVFGLWVPENVTPLVASIYKVYATICTVLFYWMFIISEAYNIYMSLEDIAKVVQASFLFLTHFAQMFKIYFFVTRAERIRKLLNSLQGSYFRARNEEQYKMLTKSIFEGKITFYSFVSMAVATCALWGVFPLIEGSDGQVELPLVSNYPFNIGNGTMFLLIYAYQIAGAVVNAVTNVSKDTVVSSLMRIICGELDVLNHTLVNIREFAINNSNQGGKEDAIQNDERNSPELEDEMNKILTECIHRHWQILESIREIEDLFNIGTLSQFIASSIIVCVTMFQLTVVEMFSVQFVSMVLYQACMLYEILLYCWFGNEIILKSGKIGISVYSSDWYRNSDRYKKNLIIIMTRAQTPMRFYAGKLFELSLVTFVSILQSSWSYFAVLRRVQDK